MSDQHSDFYTTYIKSPQWKKRRAAFLEILGNKCSNCGERDYLQVHHKNYDHLGNESIDDVEVLCTSCHYIKDEKRRAKSRGKEFDIDFSNPTSPPDSKYKLSKRQRRKLLLSKRRFRKHHRNMANKL